MKKKSAMERAMKAALLFLDDENLSQTPSGQAFCEAVTRAVAAFTAGHVTAVLYRHKDSPGGTVLTPSGTETFGLSSDSKVWEMVEGKEGMVTVYDNDGFLPSVKCRQFAVARVAARKHVGISILLARESGRIDKEEVAALRHLSAVFSSSLRKAKSWNKRLRLRADEARRETLLHAQSCIIRGSAEIPGYGKAIDYSAGTGSDFCKAYPSIESSALVCVCDVTAEISERQQGLVYLDTWFTIISKTTLDAQNALKRLNADMSRRQGECYASLSLIRYLPEAGTVEVAGCGNVGVIAFSHETMSARVVEFGPASGINGDATIVAQTLPARSGDIVLACTDGVFAAKRCNGDLYALREVCEFVRGHYYLGADELAERLLADVHEREDHGINHDDRTVAVLKIR